MTQIKTFSLVSVLLLLVLSACSSTPESLQPFQKAAYAVPDRFAAVTVEQVLRDGGNAVDAAVAAGFVLAVTFPEAGNIGGGGFFLTRFNGEHHFLDYREKAPLLASRDMYLDKNGEVIPKASLVGIRAAGVPGSVAGLWEAHQKFGTKSWKELLQPAINYAQNGFLVHPKKAKEIPGIIEWLGDDVNFKQHFGAMKEGGVFRQPELAATLKRIAEQGQDDFYRGETAKFLLAQMQRDGGLVTAKDLAEYKAVWRKPLEAKWRGYTIVTAPPPSSGGFAVIQLLKMKEYLDKEFADTTHNSAHYIHLIAEMEKRVFADRAEYFGDPDFVEIPIDELISDTYIERRAKQVKVDAISEIQHAQPGIDSPSTTHFSILDKWGNAVANTTTINWGYGSGVVVEGAGYILNNEMDDFSTKSGVANVYGVVGGTANEIQPAKRMLSSMSPTLLVEDGKVKMVVGTPGGSTIFTSVFQAIANMVDTKMNAQQAVGASRFHHQLLPPDLITHSISIPLEKNTVRELEALGYRVEPHAWEFGDVQLIEQSLGETNTASDPRGIGVSGTVQ